MKFDFNNKLGEKLSGRLELPSSGTPKNFAIFAHCFTCSKDFVASKTISRSLTEQGFGVLRFDFTGLGNSEGDFSNTNFSSNVSDLICAYHAISKNYDTPKLLIGHSLGGAAALKAAQILHDLKAVVTIGSPSDVKHLGNLFQDDVKKIQEAGCAEVNLAGRKFTIKKQFIDDIQETEILTGIKNFKKALLVLHSPLDQTVSIDHAAKIFQAALHPKSFLSLDQADHLLMKRSDADYAGKLISAWVKRYI